MKSTRRKKTNKLGSGPPAPTDHPAVLLDGRNVNTLRVQDGDELAIDEHGRVWPPPPDDALPSEIVLPRLQFVTQRGTGQWTACCPSHPDTNPSCSITERSDRSLLVHCFSGVHCDAESICAAIGLSVAHLFPTDYARRRRGCGSGNSPGRTAYGPTVDSDAPPEPRFQALADRFRNHPDRKHHLARLADLLGIPAHVLRRCGIGWADSPERWCVPERDDLGRVVGISYRHACGMKTSAVGGKRGLVIPSRPAEDGTLYVCEGMSDTAAMLAAGRRAIGRPSAIPSAVSMAWLAGLINGVTADTRVIVVGDRDDAGRDGACSLSVWLAGECERAVRWALPRRGFNDVREQWQATGNVGLKLQHGTRR